MTYQGAIQFTVDSFFHKIDSAVQQSALRAKDLKSYVKLQKFIKTHCTITQYTLQIKKCSQKECDYCQENLPSLPSDLLASVHLLPSPMLVGDSNRQKKFDDIYGTPTTERDRPSLQASGDKTADEDIKHLLNVSWMRDVITCGECLKSRCIYPAAKLSSNEVDAVNQAKEEILYVYGSELFPLDHSLNNSVVHCSILCQSPMETT